jgi:hypothetical protein
LIAGIERCIELAHEDAPARPPNHREPSTIGFQKSASRELAGTMPTDAPKRASRFRHPHHQASSSIILCVAGGSPTASSTFIRFIAGNAFVDSYTACFHPRKATHCPECGPNSRTVPHIIQRCPRYT